MNIYSKLNPRLLIQIRDLSYTQSRMDMGLYYELIFLIHLYTPSNSSWKLGEGLGLDKLEKIS